MSSNIENTFQNIIKFRYMEHWQLDSLLLSDELEVYLIYN